ncbi:Helix-turn-helix domain-containing protein [Sanguibacter gelidistatuariae]|uniref:Helix-turn-helix domain-containing protein n=1 Tax=Sanguibacter gelidistatuariae TaxID=1814289 RepID=A0A1G6MQ72_9MICO|nr:helix-turn-helix transcriptional regulator [Sanguibacter gelidistatuariae]SDC57672.1 Helix-turn-helix domain-containing protein [Sanguibacter gelidistatuariae]
MGEVIAFPGGWHGQGEHSLGPHRAVEYDAAEQAPHPVVPRQATSDLGDHPRRAFLWREIAGHELRAERVRQGRTQSDVASRAGVSTQYLSEIERGRKEPSSEVLRAVIGALGLDLVDLTGRVTRTLAATSPASSAPSASPVLQAG